MSGVLAASTASTQNPLVYLIIKTKPLQSKGMVLPTSRFGLATRGLGFLLRLTVTYNRTPLHLATPDESQMAPSGMQPAIVVRHRFSAL